MQKQIIYNTKSKPRYKSLERYRPNKKNEKRFSLSNLNFNSLFLNHQYINDFLPSFFYGIENKYKEVAKLNVKSNNTIDVFNTLIHFLNEKIDLYKVDFVTNDNKKQILIYKELKYIPYTLYFIELENIMKLKNKAKPLFQLIIGFLKKFDILYNSYIEHSKEIVNDDINENGWSKDFMKEVKYEFNGLNKINFVFEKAFFDEDLLNRYSPKKNIYKKLLNLLKKNSKILDTSIIKKLTVPYSEYEEKGNALFFNELFGFVFNNGVIFEDYILGTINSIFQEYDSIPPLDVMIIENNKIIKDFNINNNQFVLFHNFISELNDLIKEI